MNKRALLITILTAVISQNIFAVEPIVKFFCAEQSIIETGGMSSHVSMPLVSLRARYGKNTEIRLAPVTVRAIADVVTTTVNKGIDNTEIDKELPRCKKLREMLVQIIANSCVDWATGCMPKKRSGSRVSGVGNTIAHAVTTIICELGKASYARIPDNRFGKGARAVCGYVEEAVDDHFGKSAAELFVKVPVWLARAVTYSVIQSELVN